MKDRDFPGARWWKFDFHTHTPASKDFAKKEDFEPEDWLKAFMDKEIDCVAITDHNSGGWIDKLKSSLEELKHKRPSWYRDLYLFPGVEISAHGNVHILAIFGSDKSKDDINGFVDTVGYLGEKGDSDAVTNITITKIVDLISERGGIAIPAHADKENGLLLKAEGQTLKQSLVNDNIYAMELCCAKFQKPGLYKTLHVQWTEVLGSDTHFQTGDASGPFTWIKMEEPSVDGLKLALIDGDGSVNRNMHVNPNLPPDYFIEELIIDNSQFIGRSKPLQCQFSPFLNTIIGGRGSGKSTLLEFTRLVLRRDKDVPKAIRNEVFRYFEVSEKGLLIQESKISLIYRKGDVRYRLNWSSEPDSCPSLEEFRGDQWRDCPGKIKTLFPAYIYSQKQIFELARDPSALLDIIDEASEVDSDRIESERKELVNRYKQIEAKQKELKDRIDQEEQLLGKANDLLRQIEQIERSGHEDVLRIYSKRQLQSNEFGNVEGEWEKIKHRVLDLRNHVVPVSINEQHFASHPEILEGLHLTNQKWKTIQTKLDKLAEETQAILEGWYCEKKAAKWMHELKADLDRYHQLSATLEQQGTNPERYPHLLRQQKSIQKELNLIGEYQSRAQELEDEKQSLLLKIEEKRRELSGNRQAFLFGVLEDNPDVQIQVKTLGADWNSIDNEIRSILQCKDRFERDFEALREVYERNSEMKLDELKEIVYGIRRDKTNAKDLRFGRHVESLPQESLTDLTLWFPRDTVEVTFGPNNQRLEQGSPGQKTAALLAFILSYGDEPLLLDQPEDDLDNELIYDLIVKQLRKIKSKRQVIVVTHNANIVVNGDAELVLPLKFKSGETHLRPSSSIHQSKTRRFICNILEGGRYAFTQRYKRIRLEF